MRRLELGPSSDLLPNTELAAQVVIQALERFTQEYPDAHSQELAGIIVGLANLGQRIENSTDSIFLEMMQRKLQNSAE